MHNEHAPAGCPSSPSQPVSGGSARSPPEKSSRRSSVDSSYPISTSVPQLPTPPASHSNVPSPMNSMPSVTPPNYEGDSTEVVSSTGLDIMRISGSSLSLPSTAHTRKSSSPIPAHTNSHSPTDTKHSFPYYRLGWPILFVP